MTSGGGVSQDCANLAFGDGATCTAAGVQFTGQVHDSATGLDNLKARYYSPMLGRFMTPDPAGLAAVNPNDTQTWNQYAYVAGTPLEATDPLGLNGNCPNEELAHRSGAHADWNPPSWGCYSGRTPAPCGIDGWCLPAGTPGGGGQGPTDGGDPWALGPPGPGGPGDAAPTSACISALAAADRSTGGVARANAAWGVLWTAANAHNVDASLLAAIGVKETDFRNVHELNGGPGMGVFQLTNQQGVSPAQAFNLTFAANYAAGMLSSNMRYLSDAFPYLTSAQLLQATAASYNFGTGNISGNASTIDLGTTGGNYGATAVALTACFQ
jgi:RHS repeat-associated protein